MQTGPSISYYLTLFGILLGTLSTFWAYSYTRLARKLTKYLASVGPAPDAPKITRSDVISSLEKGNCSIYGNTVHPGRELAFAAKTVIAFPQLANHLLE